MAKLKNVTQTEIATIITDTDGALSDMHDVIKRMEAGYCDDLSSPAQLARNFCWMARAASSLAGQILAKAAMQEQKAELEALMKERADAEGAKR